MNRPVCRRCGCENDPSCKAYEVENGQCLAPQQHQIILWSAGETYFMVRSLVICQTKSDRQTDGLFYFSKSPLNTINISALVYAGNAVQTNVRTHGNTHRQTDTHTHTHTHTQTFSLISGLVAVGRRSRRER